MDIEKEYNKFWKECDNGTSPSVKKRIEQLVKRGAGEEAVWAIIFAEHIVSELIIKEMIKK